MVEIYILPFFLQDFFFTSKEEMELNKKEVQD